MVALPELQPSITSHEALLRALTQTAGVRRAQALPGAPRPASTGLPELDGLIDGGLPRGRITELCGPASSGRTGLALTAVAAAQRRGEAVAYIDLGDALCPEAADAHGIALQRLLWARCHTARQALLAADRVIAAGGFGLVVLDLSSAPPKDTPNRQGPPRRARRAAGDHAWVRLSHAVERTGTVLLLIGPTRPAGTFAALGLGIERVDSRWQGEGPAPRLLLGLTSRITVQRNRRGPEGKSTLVTWTLPHDSNAGHGAS